MEKIGRRKKGVKISDLAGSWDISDEEANKIKKSINHVWNEWESD